MILTGFWTLKGGYVGGMHYELRTWGPMLLTGNVGACEGSLPGSSRGEQVWSSQRFDSNGGRRGWLCRQLI